MLFLALGVLARRKGFLRTRHILARGSLALVFACALVTHPRRSNGETTAQGQVPDQGSDFDALAKSAAEDRDAGNLTEAINAYQKALQLRPDWAEGWWYVGTLNYNADRYEEAIPSFGELVGLAPQGAAGWEFLGLCEFETKDYANALTHLEKGTALGGGQDQELSRVANYHLALLLIREGEFEKATALIGTIFGQGAAPAQAKEALGLALLRIPLLPREIDPSKEALIDAAGNTAALMQQGNRNDALTSFVKLIAENPTAPYLHYRYGLALAAASQSEEAIKEMREEVRLSPESALPWIELAKLYNQEKRHEEMLEAARRAVRLAPDSAEAHRALAEALQSVGEIKDASAESDTKKKLEPEKAIRETRIAQLYGNPETGSAQSTRGTSSETGNMEGADANGGFDELARQALRAQNSGQIEDAISLYAKALEMRPGWDEGRWGLAMLEYSTSRFSDAEKDVKAWLAKNPQSGTAWGVLGLCEFSLHDYDNALIHLRRGENLGFGANRESVRTARYHLGVLLIRNGEFDRAREILASEAGGPTLAKEVQFAMGLAILRMPILPEQVKGAQVPLVMEAGGVAELLENSKYDEAYPKLEELLRRFPGTPFLHYVYGTALASFSRYDEAETQFREEMRVSPESELPLLSLVSVLLQAQRSKEALPYARKAIERAPGSAYAHYLLGRTLLEMDEARESIPELLAARQLSPESPEVHFTLARAYAKTKQPEKASEERGIFLQLKAQADQERKLQQGPTFGGFQKQSQVPPLQGTGTQKSAADQPKR